MSKMMYKNMAPLEIESRFSNEKSFFYEQDDEDQLSYDDFKPFIDRLPHREIDLIEMYFHFEKKQKEIAEFFGVTQGAISHRLSRACKRLKFLRDMPKLRDDLTVLLKPHFNDFEIDLIQTMIETTCQSKTADILNQKYKFSDDVKMTQVKIRHKFERYIDRLKKLKRHSNDLSVCCKLLEYVQKNLYMMHEVILPHFDRGYKVRIKRIC